MILAERHSHSMHYPSTTRVQRDLLSPSAFLGHVGLALTLLFALQSFSLAAVHKKNTDKPTNFLLWVDPGDIKSRNLFYGPGGQEGQPQPPVTFLKEDRSATNPK